MTYSSIKILIFIFVYVFILECDGLSFLKTNILVTKFGPQTKNHTSASCDAIIASVMECDNSCQGMTVMKWTIGIIF